MHTQQYIDGWNYRCSYVFEGKYKLPRYSKKTADFHEGFADCNSEYNKAIAHAIANKINPIYPKEK